MCNPGNKFKQGETCTLDKLHPDRLWIPEFSDCLRTVGLKMTLIELRTYFAGITYNVKADFLVVAHASFSVNCSLYLPN